MAKQYQKKKNVKQAVSTDRQTKMKEIEEVRILFNQNLARLY